MDSLKATMALALAGDPVEGGWCFDPTDEEYSDPHAHNMRMDFLRQADAAISTFEAVLLSDDAVVAAGDVIAGEFHADLPMMTGEAYSQVAKAALQAALAAAKGTEDEQEDCGCTSIDYGWYGDDGGIVNVIQCSDEGCPRAAKGAEGSA